MRLYLLILLFDALNEQVHLPLCGYGDDFPGSFVFLNSGQSAFPHDAFPDQIGKEGLKHGESVRDGDIGIAPILQIADKLQDALLIGELKISLCEKLEEDAQGEAIALLCGWRVVSLDSDVNEKIFYMFVYRIHPSHSLLLKYRKGLLFSHTSLSCCSRILR